MYDVKLTGLKVKRFLKIFFLFLNKVIVCLSLDIFTDEFEVSTTVVGAPAVARSGVEESTLRVVLL